MHSEIVRYVDFMKIRLSWYGDSDELNRTFIGRCFKTYLQIRWFSLALQFAAIFERLYNSSNNMGLEDGTLIYVSLTLNGVVLSSIFAWSGRKQKNLTNTFDIRFNSHDSLWMTSIRRNYLQHLWKAITIFCNYNFFFVFLYVPIPFVLDTVLHFGFDSIDNHLSLPMPFTPFIDNSIWNWSFYLITLINWFWVYELVAITQAALVEYALLTIFYLSELKIFEEKIKALNVRQSENVVIQELNDLITWHDEVIQLNKDLKSYLGLQCAFQSLFTSFNLTLTLFTLYTSTSIAVMAGYTAGFLLNLSTALIYCSIGQLLETESDEVFRALYDLPWYRYSPYVRKNLNMMMRQAHKPLIIDFHGKFKMNLVNFMQILRQSYSYFALLQSVIS